MKTVSKKFGFINKIYKNCNFCLFFKKKKKTKTKTEQETHTCYCLLLEGLGDLLPSFPNNVFQGLEVSVSWVNYAECMQRLESVNDI